MPVETPSPTAVLPDAPATPDLEVLREPERVSALLDPRKKRLLEALRERPDSASGLARRLGEPRQRLNYHLRALEEAGLVELHEERQRRGLVERVMKPTALRFVVDPEAVDELLAEGGTAGPSAGDRLSAAHVVALAARTVREVAGLGERARDEGKRLATMGIEAEVHLGTPRDFHAFVEALSTAVAGVVAQFDRPVQAARPFRLVITGHPAGSKGEGSKGAGSKGEGDAKRGRTRPPGPSPKTIAGAKGGRGVGSQREEPR